MGFNHPDYTIIRELGYGASGVVYLAVQNQLNRRVAVKVFNDPVSIAGTRGDADRRFLREARILAQLDHPNIVPVYELSPLPNQQGYLLAMAYIEGGTLRQRAPEFSLRQALHVVEQIATALSYAHQSGFVHRDVKPDNILFQNDQAMLADFGIARAADSETRMTQHGAMLGTPEYMSPEQVNGDEVDARSDLYSLGIVFYELLTGNTPFRADSAIATGIQHLTADARELPQVFAVYQPLMDRMLAKARDSRQASATELVTELQHATANMRWPLDEPLSELRTQPVMALNSSDNVRTLRRSVWPTVARALAAVIVIGAIVLWLARGAFNDTTQSPTEVIALVPEAPVPHGTASEDRAVAEYVLEEPVVEEPVVEEPVLEEPVLEGPVLEEPANEPVAIDEEPVRAPELPESDSGVIAGDAPTDTTDPIAEQVKLAIELWQQGQWFIDEPNAVSELAKVQDVDPNRQQVNDALEDIFNRTYASAEQSVAEAQLDLATAELARLQRYWPGDGRLTSLVQRIQTAEEKQRQLVRQQQLAQERQSRIQNFISRAESAERNGDLFQPDDANAFYYYRQALAEDADNNSAIKALASLKRRELSHISSLSERSEFDAAEARLALLDSRYPADAEVARASRTVTQQKRQYEEQLEASRQAQALEASISSLRVSVEQWLGDTSPSALSSYRDFETRISDLRAQSPENATLDWLELNVQRHAERLQARRDSEAEKQVDDTFNMPGF